MLSALYIEIDTFDGGLVAVKRCLTMLGELSDSKTKVRARANHQVHETADS